MKTVISIQLNDLSFVRKCWEAYGINRGVYNTIDEWLFENGFESIEYRRKLILLFLEDSSKGCIDGKVAFGKGGVIPALMNFTERIKRRECLQY